MHKWLSQPKGFYFKNTLKIFLFEMERPRAKIFGV